MIGGGPAIRLTVLVMGEEAVCWNTVVEFLHRGKGSRRPRGWRGRHPGSFGPSERL